jgi:hypothetical protein
VGILLAHLVIIINHVKAQALNFLLESDLNKVMGSSIGLASLLFEVQLVIAVEVMILTAGGHRRGFQDRWYRPRSNFKYRDIRC